MERLEIMVRLACTEWAKDTPTVDLAGIADELIAEDAKRTAAETRPDRPAKVEWKDACMHACEWTRGTDGKNDWVCCVCNKGVGGLDDKADSHQAPRVKWRPGTELPPENTACLIDGNVEAGGALVNGGHYGIGFYNGGGRWFIPFAGDVTPKRWLPLKEIV